MFTVGFIAGIVCAMILEELADRWVKRLFS